MPLERPLRPRMLTPPARSTRSGVATAPDCCSTFCRPANLLSVRLRSTTEAGPTGGVRPAGEPPTGLCGTWNVPRGPTGGVVSCGGPGGPGAGAGASFGRTTAAS